MVKENMCVIKNKREKNKLVETFRVRGKRVSPSSVVVVSHPVETRATLTRRPWDVCDLRRKKRAKKKI